MYILIGLPKERGTEMANQNEELLLTEADFDFDALEQSLEQEFNEKNLDLELAVQDREKIGNPQCLVEAVGNVAWDQFINQVGVVAGEDFIKENRGLTLDLSNDVHIQTAEDFAKGKFPSHNSEMGIYKKRYDDWQLKFKHDENGNIIIHTTRTGTQEATLEEKVRKPFDEGRPTGSVERGTDMDHTVSASEIIHDPAANAFLTKKEQIAFANSEANLNEIPSSWNRSKGDKSMSDWLNNPNSKGQKPTEIFDISQEDEEHLREKEAEARAEYNRVKNEGEKRAKTLGRQSQKEETLRLGGKALRSTFMILLAELMKEILQKLVAWFRAGKRNISTFIDALKESLKSFSSNLKQHLLNVGDVLMTTVFAAIWGPIVGTLKKVWMLLKQGYKSLKEAISFFQNPANQNMPFSIKVMEAGKILIAGLTAGGAILLSEVIEKGLMAVAPPLAYPIPLLGSLASLLGLFFGALVSGIIGAIGLNLIDKLIANKQRALADKEIIETGNEILLIQGKQLELAQQSVAYTKERVEASINARHTDAVAVMKDKIQGIRDVSESIRERNEQVFDEQRENQMSEDFDAALQRIRNILK